MKKFFLFLISLLIGVLLLIWIIKFVGWEEIKIAFSAFTSWQGVIIFLLTLFLALVGIWKWKEILKGYEVNISFFDLFKFYLAGFSLTYFFPMMFLSGEIFRGYLLKRKNSIPWSKGMASVIIDRISDWTTNLISIFFGIIFFILTITFPPKKWVVIFGGTFLFWLIGISFFFFKVFKRESIVRFFLKFINYKNQNSEPLEVEKEIFNFFKPEKSFFWRGIGLAFLEEVVTFLRTWFLIIFFGKSVGFLSILSIIGFSYLAGMMPIPAALGIHEVIQVFAFSSLGLGAATGTVFTMIIRGAELILALVGLCLFFRLGFKLTEESLFKKEEIQN